MAVRRIVSGRNSRAAWSIRTTALSRRTLRASEEFLFAALMMRELLVSPAKRPTPLATAAALSSALLVSPVAAADLPIKAPEAIDQVYDWTGFYVGGHFGFGWGASRWNATP